MPTLSVANLGAIAQLMYEGTVRTYCQKHHGRMSYEELLANEVRSTDVSLDVLGPRVVHANCTIHSKRWIPSHHEFSRWHACGDGRWSFQGGTLDL